MNKTDQSVQTTTQQADLTARATTAQGNTSDSFLKPHSKTTTIVPVLVHHISNPQQERLVYAMLDTQSDTSFILNSTREALNAPDTTTTLIADRINGLRIRGLNEEITIPLPPTYTRSIMPANRSHIPTPDTTKKWPHLHPIINHLSHELDCEIGLLIGYNCTQALIPREVIPHPDNDGPYGQRIDLGWSVVGVTSPSEVKGDAFGISHRILTKEEGSKSLCQVVMRTSAKELFTPVYSHDPNHEPNDLIKILQRDFSETQGPFDSETYLQEDLIFLKLMNEEITKDTKGHYEMPLPLREDKLPLPDNYEMALARLRSLKRRFDKDFNYRKAYTAVMQNILNKRFAEPASLDSDGWYLPHHGVKSQKKPGTVRVVFDASARHHGHSLNDALMQGPDLTNKLIGVLCRFRRETVAISCDIEAMFHQFHVASKHRNYLRFLWWPDGDTSQSPKVFRMTVHLFGAKSSPSCANFGLKRIATEYGENFDKSTVDFIQRDFYVDDGLSSQPSDREAINLINQTKQICSLAGLRLHKFLSNSRSVMQSIPAEDRATCYPNCVEHDTHCEEGTELPSDPLSVDRVLGVRWFVKHDKLGFHISITDQPSTRRGILSTVASIYDPLGLAAPVILQGKQIVQDVCRDNLDWDDPLPDTIKPKWIKWQQELPYLEHMKITRCYKPVDFGEVLCTELHHFADACLSGYGTCSYLRQVSSAGLVHCSLVFAKARVAPLRPITVPRLELTAALVAVRVSRMLDKELHMNAKHIFWSDSKAVLGYIANQTSKYQIFVANRVQEIRENTRSHQWNHVPTDQNPADLASRGCSARELVANESWLYGPQFLQHRNLPYNKVESVTNSDMLKGHTLATTALKDGHILSCMCRLSSWIKMKRVLALCINMKKGLTGRLKP